MPGEYPAYDNRTMLQLLHSVECGRVHKSRIGYVHMFKHIASSELNVDLSFTKTTSRLFPFLRISCSLSPVGFAEGETLKYKCIAEAHARLGKQRIHCTLAHIIGTFSRFQDLVHALLDLHVGDPGMSVQECITNLQNPDLVEATFDNIVGQMDLPTVTGNVLSYYKTKIHIRQFNESVLLKQAKKTLLRTKELSHAR